MPISHGVPYIGGPIVSATAGSIIFASSNNVIGQNNANLFWDNTNNRLGIITASPTNALSFGGTATRKIWMERHTTANTAGNSLTIEAGGATSLATNKAGGALTLKSGQATGTQGSSITLQTCSNGTTGTADNTFSTKLNIDGKGQATFTSTAATGGINGLTQNTTASNLGNTNSFNGQNWSFSASGIQDGGIEGLIMQLSCAVNASDTGNSSITGFDFQIFEDGDHTANTGATAQAVGGFIRHSSTAAGLGFTGFNCDIQIAAGASAASLTLYDVGISSIAANTTSWTAYHVNDPIPSGGVITTAYGLKIENVTGATTNYAIWVGGGQSVHAGNLKLGDTTAPTEQLELADAKNIKFQTTTGTKIATATGQRLAFWNKTPIVQPTTAIAAATFVANTSGIANDTATFDGFTIGQVVKALRNVGLLA